MSLQAMKYAAFEAVTPQFLKEIYAEHGREIANAESLARIPLAPYLLITAAFGVKGVVPALVRVGKAAEDGHDGYVAHQDREFGKVDTTIPGALGAIQETASVVLGPGDIRGKLKSFVDVLHDIDGPKLDADCDKFAQVADQAGGLIHGDVTPLYFGSNLARIAWIDFGVRPAYRKLGIKASATPISQGKTLVQDLTQAAEASGVLDRFPTARRVLSAAGIGVTALSAFDIMRVAEQKYLDTLGIARDDYSVVHAVGAATVRTAAFITGQPVPQQAFV